MGGATYGAMMQNQIAAADRGRRSGLVEDEELRMQRQGQLDNLIGQQMNEDARLDQMAMQGYGMDMQLYNQRLMMEEANRRQAMQNVVGSAAALGADLPNTVGQMGNADRQFARQTFRQGNPLMNQSRNQISFGMNPSAINFGMNPYMPQPMMKHQPLDPMIPREKKK
jgi:hypothetical protein